MYTHSIIYGIFAVCYHCVFVCVYFSLYGIFAVLLSLCVCVCVCVYFSLYSIFAVLLSHLFFTLQDSNYPQLDIDDVLKISESDRKQKLTVYITNIVPHTECVKVYMHIYMYYTGIGKLYVCVCVCVCVCV